MTTRRVHPHEHHFQPQPEHPEGTVHHVDPLTVIEAEQLKQKIAEAKRMTLDKLMSSFSAENLKKFWKDLFESDVAKASAMWSLMSSLLPTLSIYFLYVFFLTVNKQKYILEGVESVEEEKRLLMTIFRFVSPSDRRPENDAQEKSCRFENDLDLVQHFANCVEWLDNLSFMQIWMAPSLLFPLWIPLPCNG